MNSMERFGSVLQGELPDRTPIIGNLLEQGARELGLTIEQYYSNGEYVAEGQLKLRQKYGYDNVLGFFYGARSAEMLGCRKVIYSQSGPPNVGHLIITKPQDIEGLEIPADISSVPAFAELARCITILKREVGGVHPIGGVAIGSFSLPAILMGIEGWLDLLLSGPESLRREMLEKCSDFCIREIRALRQAGVDYVCYFNPVASVDVITKQQFNNLALEWIVRDINAVGPQGVGYFNGGGRINPTIDSIITTTGIPLYYINPFDDIAEAKRIVGDRGVSSGVINDIRLLDWSAEEIDLEVQRIMKAGTAGGRFVFGTLVMPYQIPEHNIMTLFDSARRHGSYSEPA